MDTIKGTQTASPVSENPSGISLKAGKAREQALNFASFADENPNPVAHIDGDGMILYANQACAPLLAHWGIKEGERLPPEPRQWVQSVLTVGEFREVEITIDERTYTIVLAPIPGSGYIGLYGRDITQQKIAEDALQIARARFRRIVDATFIGIVTAKADGSILEANDYYLDMLGYTQEELRAGKVRWIDMTPPEYLPLDQIALQELEKTGICSPYQKEYFRKDGSRVWVMLADAMLPGKGGEIAAFILEITAQKALEADLARQRDELRNANEQLERELIEHERAEEAVRRSAHRLRVINQLDHVISSSLDIGTVYDAFVQEMKDLVEFDRTSIILLDNAGENWQIIRQWTQGKPAFQPAVWYPVKGTAFEWVGQNRRAYLESRLGEKAEWPEHKGLREEGIQSRVLLPLINQGKVIGLLTFASRQAEAYPASEVELLRALAAQLAIAVQNNRLYEQARLMAEELELRVQARTAQLEKANKDLESFSYSVSHDLRAPLRAINGFAQILARRHRADLNEEGQHYLDNVVEASTRMGILIDDLLQYSRVGRASVHRQTVRLEELFAQILSDLSSRITETQAEVHLPPPPGSMALIQSDPTILSQIFTNIIDNALTFHRPGIPPAIQVTYQAEVDHYLFGIADNGIGIPTEYLEKIFNVFQRLHSSEEFPGTGIGLAIVKKSAELLNGRVWADSTEGVGSTFWIQIPKE
jgi:PAS domain S-box-containing protein